ncbi:MAG: GNAT family N-acetyltransferase [Bacteroidetes bacterium]|nr:GNAT family N-acetyltransferase [Bacteroidota bacterium]
MNHSVKIIEPQTPKEFEAYYLVRFNTLRKPWNQPLGSEKDQFEENSIHAMATDSTGSVLGVCRLQYNSPTEGQLRFMGVVEDARGMGIGKLLLDYLEKKAKYSGAKTMILQARENALPFYLKCGYSTKEKTHLLWGEIQHYLMTKEL